MSPEGFALAFQSAARNNDLTVFEAALGDADMLLIDHAQQAFARPGARELLLRAFDRLQARRRSVLLSASEAPDIGVIGRRRRRLIGGEVYQLEAPDEALRLKILRSTVARRRLAAPQIEVDERLLRFLAERLRAAPRTVILALERVMSAAQLLRRPATVALARFELADLLRRFPEPPEVRRRNAVRYGLRLA